MDGEHGTAKSTAGLTMERIVLNDALFREANDGIRDAAERHLEEGAEVPFICECADPNCNEIVRMTLDDYREMRSDARLFVNVPGHQASAHGHVGVVANQDGRVIVEKLGLAGDLAEDLESDQLLPPHR